MPRDDKDERRSRVRQCSRHDDFEDRNWRSQEQSQGDRYDDIDRSERLIGNRRERVRKGRRVSDFQTIEVDGKLAISVEDLIAAGVIFRE
jgi:hypothetical protein